MKQLFSILILLASTVTFAQVVPDSLDSDELFKRGRELVFNDQAVEGRMYLIKALEKSPSYHEIRIFLARTYAWDDNYAAAEQELQYILIEDVKNKDAYLALVDVYNWSDQDQKLYDISINGLKHYPTNEKLILAKAKSLIALDRKKEAVVILTELLSLYPGNESAKNLINKVKGELMQNAISVDYEFNAYTTTFGFQQFQNITYKRITKLGSVNLRLNTAQRFDRFGSQLEFDAYPGLYDGAYMYVSYAYSNTDLFPSHRYGLELFQSLPASLEASIGMRALFFSGSVNIYTASLGWYVGNMWLNARTYLTPAPEVNNTSRSLTVTARYYIKGAQSYIGMSSGFGFSPETQIEPDSEIYFFRSHKVDFDFQKSFGPRWLIRAQAGMFDLELTYRKGDFSKAFRSTLNIEYRF